MERPYLMKSIFKIHPLFYLVALLTVLTGNFKDFILVFLIVMIHELGHITVALYYRWNISRVVILPFGGMTIFEEYLNRPWKEEFLIAIAGPIYQIIFYQLLCIFHLNTELFQFYHYALLFFNLLPMIPLDGSKILNLLFQKRIPYQKSNSLMGWISIVVINFLFFFLYYYRNFIMFIFLFFLFIQIIKQMKKQRYLFHKFILERYTNSFSFFKIKMIKGVQIHLMMRECNHYFLENNHYFSEKEILHRRFHLTSFKA